MHLYDQDRLKVDPVKYDHSLLSVPEFLLNHGQQSVFAELYEVQSETDL